MDAPEILSPLKIVADRNCLQETQLEGTGRNMGRNVEGAARLGEVEGGLENRREVFHHRTCKTVTSGAESQTKQSP